MMFPNGHLPRSTVGTDRPDNFSLNKPLKSLSVPTREPGFPHGIQQVRGGVWAEGAEEEGGPGNPVLGLPRMPRKEFSGRPDIPPMTPAPSTRTMERG